MDDTPGTFKNAYFDDSLAEHCRVTLQAPPGMRVHVTTSKYTGMYGGNQETTSRVHPIYYEHSVKLSVHDGEDISARLAYESLRPGDELNGPCNLYSSGRSLTFEFDFKQEKFYDSEWITINYEFVRDETVVAKSE